MNTTGDKSRNDKEELEKEEAERLKNIESAKKELEKTNKQAPVKKTEIDEQDSDGSANAFENK